jgi:chromosome segregation ATPase
VWSTWIVSDSFTCLQYQGENKKLATQSELAEERADEAEGLLKEANAQMRNLTSRATALESQLRAKEAEVEEANAEMSSCREGRSETESRVLQLQADLRGACADTANLTAQLGVQTALARSREVEIEELKAAMRDAGVREVEAGDVLDDTVGEMKRLKAECAKLQCLLKSQVRSWLGSTLPQGACVCRRQVVLPVQVATLRAREAEVDEIRGSYTAAEARGDNLRQRLKVSGVELAKAEEALKVSQRKCRSMAQRLDESGAQCQALQAALQSSESQKGNVQVCSQSGPSALRKYHSA